MRSIILTIVLWLICEPASSLSDWKPWQPSWKDAPKREDLLCPIDDCSSPLYVNKSLDECCTCKSSATWEGFEKDLFIEYVSVLGHSLVLSKQTFSQGSYQIIHTDHYMTEIPSNICNWDSENTRIHSVFQQQFMDFKEFWHSVVKIDFSNNKIERIVDLNCLTRLDTLNLQYNDITHLTNTSFSNLTNLRKVNFANNLITAIEPSIISAPMARSLLKVDMADNFMESIDVSNVFSYHPYCEIDYSNNNINEMINDNGFTLERSQTYGPGFTSFENNIFNTFPDFKGLLGLQKLGEIGKFFKFGFNFLGVQISCDCNIEPYLELAKDIISAIWLDYMNIKCVTPAKFKNVLVFDVPLEELVCNITAPQGCPPLCKCVDRPNENTMFVDCSNNPEMRSLPDTLPESIFSSNINLNVSGNSITEITNVSYIGQISNLDISRNSLIDFDNNDAKLLENATTIDLSDNRKLQTLPQSFQYRNTCGLEMSNLLINCDCESSWIDKWLRSKSCHGAKSFNCYVPDVGEINAHDFRSDDLICTPSDNLVTTISVILASIVGLLIIFGFISYQFRYEIIILLLRLRRQKKNNIYPQFKYDVFLSFDYQNEDLLIWVENEFRPKLISAGYKVFIPYRDINIGDVRDIATIDSLKTIRNFLLILSDSYLSQETEEEEVEHSWTENEWKYGWHMFRGDSSRNIVIINYDHVSSLDVNQRQIKAFLRVGGQVNFTNRERDIFQEVSTKLGPPTCNHKKRTTNVKKDEKNNYEAISMHLFDINNGETPEDQQIDDNIAVIETEIFFF